MLCLEERPSWRPELLAWADASIAPPTPWASLSSSGKGWPVARAAARAEEADAARSWAALRLRTAARTTSQPRPALLCPPVTQLRPLAPGLSPPHLMLPRGASLASYGSSPRACQCGVLQLQDCMQWASVDSAEGREFAPFPLRPWGPAPPGRVWAVLDRARPPRLGASIIVSVVRASVESPSADARHVAIAG